jgi:hypothetical protein
MNTKIRQRVDELLDQGTGALQDLARLIDAYDMYTYGHSERVCQYATMLGRAMDLDWEHLTMLRDAAWAHDLGKVDVPLEILNKPGRLTGEEFEVIKQHPSTSAEILERDERFADVLPAVRHHHERVDGRGYPDGLLGDAIPLESRILAVVDAYDAMVSHRPYRHPMSIDTAMEQIRKCAGTQFDEAIAASFLTVLDDRMTARMRALGASTMLAEFSYRQYEDAALEMLGKHTTATLHSLAGLLRMRFPELASEQAGRIIQATLFPGEQRDDLYGDDLDQLKDDEIRIRFPARIDADVCSVVRCNGVMYCVVDIADTADGQLEYHLKR